MWVLAHGETQGGGVDSALSFVGVQQAMEAGAYLQVVILFYVCVCDFYCMYVCTYVRT
jgi:hypothetical protein